VRPPGARPLKSSTDFADHDCSGLAHGLGGSPLPQTGPSKRSGSRRQADADLDKLLLAQAIALRGSNLTASFAGPLARPCSRQPKAISRGG